MFLLKQQCIHKNLDIPHKEVHEKNFLESKTSHTSIVCLLVQESKGHLVQSPEVGQSYPATIIPQLRSMIHMTVSQKHFKNVTGSHIKVGAFL